MNDDKWKEESKTRLKKIIKKKMNTVMIGGLSAVEEKFAEFLEKDIEFRNLYDELRSVILDSGNHQIRNMETELEQYDINWKRYHLELPVKPRKFERAEQ